MFELSVEDYFSAAHWIKGYPGDCCGVHGHTYRVRVRVRIKKLNKLGMAIDFRRVKKALMQILKDLDHKNLNSLAFFKRHNSTAEWIAVYIYNNMKKKIDATVSVTVWEGPNNSVTYTTDVVE